MSEVINTPSVFGEAIGAVAAGRDRISITGLWGSSRALFLCELMRGQKGPVVALTATAKQARALASDYAFFAGHAAGAGKDFAYFPPWDVLPNDVIEPDPSVVAERLGVLRAVRDGSVRLVVAPVKALMQLLPPPDALVGEGALVKLARGGETGFDGFIERLDASGYTRASTVYEPGEFSVRGGIVDLYTPGPGGPLRVEFFGDTVDSIRSFDPDTQRSTARLDEAEILPATENGGSAAEGLDDLAAYFREAPLVVVDEFERVLSRAGEFGERYLRAADEGGAGAKARGAHAGDDHPADQGGGRYMDESGVRRFIARHRAVFLDPLVMEAAPAERDAESFAYASRSVEGMRLRDLVPRPWPEELPRTPVSIACLNLKRLLTTHAVNVVSPTAGQAKRLREIFTEHGLPAVEGGPAFQPQPPESAAARIVEGELDEGFTMDAPGLAFVTAKDIFGEKQKRAPVKKAKVERFLTSLSELNQSDYVVHVDHGIGRYEGIKRLKLLGVETDFLEVVYSGSDRLYVPVDELGKLQKYIGGESAAPKLDRLGGVAWERTKAKAKKAVEDMARELLELYAARAVAPGHSYGPEDDGMYRELESSFEYEETPDQTQAIRDVEKGLAEPHPMDRLVCGDVGYGKTEVAVRAAFKVVLGGRQALVLVPTTLLASQHFETFTERLAPFPVNVEMMSRFRSKAEQKKVIEGLAAGTVDIAIGTHRLLSKDVRVNDLGLVVVDEEHRFGVRHKEKLRALKKQVDVLTLSATPIPRTLHMSISGIRELSIIETPPPDRQPIKTMVARFDKAVIREAVMRELERGGQVFFVHNRIESIFAVGRMLAELLPDAKIGVAHGRMREDLLEGVMGRFVSGETDVLLSTSIIESGLDIPGANTIIIDRADRFGLADLYQLRGRVGRSRVRAYAYLLVPGEEALTETAKKRLQVLSELTELGAGFKLALHDLEIRGAGDILGSQQSGHISAVGFELYTQMLAEAVSELKGEPAGRPVEPALDLKVSAFIPEAYVPDTAHRLGIYKRLAGAVSRDELADLAGELADRYGPVPEPTRRLVEVMELKCLARILGAAGIQLLPSEIKISFTEKVSITPDRLLGFLGRRKKTARYVPQYTIFIKRPRGGWDELFPEIRNCLLELA